MSLIMRHTILKQCIDAVDTTYFCFEIAYIIHGYMVLAPHLHTAMRVDHIPRPCRKYRSLC